MSPNTSLTTATTTNHQPISKGAAGMLIKRIFLTLLITGVITTSATVTLSAGRKSWPKGATVNNLALAYGAWQQVKGTESVVNNGNGTTSGTITQGGKLNGTTQTVFTSDFTPTPDPNTFSFTDDLTLTTDKGVLRTHNVTLFDAANGVFSAIARIDPNGSTGDFAGATGVLYINGKTTDGGATFQAEITGEICFAN